MPSIKAISAVSYIPNDFIVGHTMEKSAADLKALIFATNTPLLIKHLLYIYHLV